MNYTIDENLTIRVYEDGNGTPILEQPDYPDYTPFEDAAAASAWAELFIAAAIDPNAPYAPSGPGKVGEPKLTERPNLDGRAD